MQSERGLSFAEETFSSSARDSRGEPNIFAMVEVVMRASRKDRRDDVMAPVFELTP